jgi:hypothetical protein
VAADEVLVPVAPRGFWAGSVAVPLAQQRDLQTFGGMFPGTLAP